MVDNPISTEQILKNIYGVTATGTVSNMSGGNINKKYINIDNIQRAVLRDDVVSNNIRIKYLDEKPATNIMTGGRRRTRKTRKLKAGSKAKDIVIYASPEYVETSSDLRLFMDKFFLYYRFSRSPNSAIYIIPPSAELSKMINKRAKDKPEGSMELQKDVRSNKNIGLEKYLFVTFGDNSKSDKYRIDPNLNSKEAYPNSPFETIRRTNLNGDVFYISYKDDKSVVIHTKPDNINSKDSETLNFVARFNNGGYIFQGSIPDHSEEHIGPKQIKKSKLYKFAFDEMEFGDIPVNDYNARSTAITGGASNNSLKTFELYDRLYNYDHDVAAEHFLRCAAKKDKLPKNIINNADFLYSAIYYALSKPNAVNANDINKEISLTRDKETLDAFSLSAEDSAPLTQSALNPKATSFKHWTKEQLKNAVAECVAAHPEFSEFAADFVDYWYEPTASGKPRLWRQDAWDTTLRLRTWAKKELGHNVAARPVSGYSVHPEAGTREWEELHRREMEAF